MRYDEHEYPPYVSVAERRASAEKKLRQLQKTNPRLKPVILAGQALAKTWWGKSWNSNLERYADYNNRIGRGRSYVRHRCVLDLHVSAGHVTALVQGSSPHPYKIGITIDPLSASNWSTIRAACAGGFDSLGELLAGKFPQAFKDLFLTQGSGLFPAPRDIHFQCSCPDWASMCKHVAAALYGVGSRLDDEPSLFFTLRGLQMDELITQTVVDTAETLLRKAEGQSRHILRDVDLGEMFGIQLDASDVPMPALLPVRPSSAPPPQTTPRARRAPTVVSQPAPTSAVVAPASAPAGTMLEALLTVLGRSRKGRAIDVLETRLGWTKTQLRNALSRASAKGLLETITPGVYRRKI